MNYEADDLLPTSWRKRELFPRCRPTPTPESAATTTAPATQARSSKSATGLRSSRQFLVPTLPEGPRALSTLTKTNRTNRWLLYVEPAHPTQIPPLRYRCGRDEGELIADGQYRSQKYELHNPLPPNPPRGLEFHGLIQRARLLLILYGEQLQWNSGPTAPSRS